MNAPNVRDDEYGRPWYFKDGKWLPCTQVRLKDGSIEWLQATEEEIMAAVHPN